ncbi:hypothetical protein GAMM_160072 [Gammaproteobacteria bacterium]
MNPMKNSNKLKLLLFATTQAQLGQNANMPE